MAQTSKENLKKYFETGDKPTQTEYTELIDAFRHVDDKLPIADVESLQTSLDSKASSGTVLNHLNDDSIHVNGTDKTSWNNKLDSGGYSGTGQDLKDLIDNIEFLDPNNPPLFIDSDDSDSLKDSIRFTFKDGSIVDVSIKDLADLGALNGVATNGFHNIEFTTLGGQTTSIDLDEWFNRKVTLNESGDPLKVFNELGQAVLTPQLKSNSVLIDSINGNDTTGQLENFSNPYKTIQAALNAYRDSAGFSFSNFLTVEFVNDGEHTFGYLSTPNVIFKSNQSVNIKAVSTGDNFTTNSLEVSHPYYANYDGSLILDLPNGTFEHNYIDDGTFVRQPIFNLKNFIIRSLDKLIVYNKTRLQYNYTGYSKPIPFTVSNFCDFGGVDIETNMSLIYILSDAKKSKLNFGNVLIHKQDEALEDASPGIISPLVLVKSLSDFEFSYNKITITATTQSKTILNTTKKPTSPIQFGDVINDPTNDDCILFYGGDGTKSLTLHFNNSDLQNCQITDSGYIRFTGSIASTSGTKITGVGGSWIRDWTFDNFTGNFNLSDASGALLLHLYQIGSNTNNTAPTTTLNFINTKIKSKGGILLLRDTSPTTTYPATNFLGTNILECESSEIIQGYIGQAVRFIKTGTLITNKALHSSASSIPITDSGYYQEIT